MRRPNSDQNECEKEKQKHKKRENKKKNINLLREKKHENPIDSGSKLMC